MLLHLHRPGSPLDRFVELVTFFADYDPQHSKERLLPDGAVEIVVDLTDTPKRLFDRDDHTRWTAFRGAWISGMRRGWIVIEAAPMSSMAVIRFRPGGAYPFLGFGVEGLDAVLAQVTASLRDRILEASTLEAKMQAVEAWLLERAAGRLEASPVVDYVTSRLFAPAEMRIAPPVEPDWAAVAADHGYCDQSHLIRDFREFAGMSPGEYLASYRGLENYLPFD